MVTDTANEQANHNTHTHVTIIINATEVTFHQDDATGAHIKQTAISQGMQIEPDFPLFLIRHGQPLRQIADTETVELHDREAFRAVPDDDNS
jgi:hypothetical protein